MTATTSVAVPMMAATAAAVLAAELLRSRPIYDSLGDRMPIEIAAVRDDPADGDRDGPAT
jgi:CIC family chloride channel protein